MEGGAFGHNFEIGTPRTIPAKLGLIWFSDCKSSGGLWPAEL